jgi:hypothetical protein
VSQSAERGAAQGYFCGNDRFDDVYIRLEYDVRRVKIRILGLGIPFYPREHLVRETSPLGLHPDMDISTLRRRANIATTASDIPYMCFIQRTYSTHKIHYLYGGRPEQNTPKAKSQKPKKKKETLCHSQPFVPRHSFVHLAS